MKLYLKIVDNHPLLVISSLSLILGSTIAILYWLSYPVWEQILLTDLFVTETQAGFFENMTVSTSQIFFGILLLIVVALSLALPITLYLAFEISSQHGNIINRISQSFFEILSVLPAFFYAYIFITLIPFTLDWVKYPLVNMLMASIIIYMMIFPTLLSLIERAFSKVPVTFFESALGLGASSQQFAFRVLVPMTLPNIIAAILVGIVRVITEIILLGVLLGVVLKTEQAILIIALVAFVLLGISIAIRRDEF